MNKPGTRAGVEGEAILSPADETPRCSLHRGETDEGNGRELRRSPSPFLTRARRKKACPAVESGTHQHVLRGVKEGAHPCPGGRVEDGSVVAVEKLRPSFAPKEGRLTAYSGAAMLKAYASIPAFLFLVSASAVAETPTPGGPETVVIHNGPVALHALVFRPQGPGPFPAILLNHGSGRTAEELKRLGPYEGNAERLGPLFVRHGYVFLYLFRRGVGPSTDQGANAVDLMNRESAKSGQEARNALQLGLLEGREMTDALAALKFLRALPEVSAHNVGVIGHSFGGSLTLLMAEREPDLRAIVVFSAAGYSFDRSPELRRRLVAALPRIEAPVFFIHAENDYSLSSGKALDLRLEQLGKPHRLKLYPPIGRTVDDGHDFLHLGISTWEPDVLAFLDEHMRK